MSYLSSPEKEREILHLESRRKIYLLVKQFSGCSFHDLKRESSIAAGTLRYHLHYLAKYGVITAQKDGNKIRYFAKDIAEKDRKVLVLLRQKKSRHIVLQILNKKACSQRELVQILGVAPSTMSEYLAKLVKNQVLNAVKKEGGLQYSLAMEEAEIIGVLITYKESFLDKLVDQTIDMWAFRV